MSSLLSTSHINLNYPLPLQLIILIKFSVCNPAGNYLRNPRLNRHSTGLARLCLSRVSHHKETNLKKEPSWKNRQKLPTTPKRSFNTFTKTRINKPSLALVSPVSSGSTISSSRHWSTWSAQVHSVGASQLGWLLAGRIQFGLKSELPQSTAAIVT